MRDRGATILELAVAIACLALVALIGVQQLGNRSGSLMGSAKTKLGGRSDFGAGVNSGH